MGKKKRRGHFCIGCEEYLPNEKFSGKGHRKHLCKKCQKSNKAQSTNQYSDENFAFIASYTSNGFPYGITYEEWEEIEPSFEEKDPEWEYELINLPEKVAAQLRNLNVEDSLKKSIYFSIAISLLVTNSISHFASSLFSV
ncbi:hypothetical protein ACQYAD_12070 [Neobacillus sp. SM06]|uniref:hypothetical protein n=1 Tax=Neobacillus sp. SM06 TaxID=3422492 RepID=UPI003D283167